MTSRNEIPLTNWFLVIVALSCVVGCNQPLTSSNTPLPSDTGETRDLVSQPSASSPNGSDEAPIPPSDVVQAEASASGSDPIVQAQDDSLPPAPDHVYEPKVLLSDGHRATCVLGVGDLIPELNLSRQSGETAQLMPLLGDKLTVVVFWSRENRFAREQVSRLDHEVVEPFSDYGIRVVAINCQDSPDDVKDLLPTDGNAGSDLLFDKDGEAFAKFATEHLPRTYILDTDGRILWFYLGYSRGSARELTNAIHFFLGNRSASES